ncbi:leucyl aminopeptidase [Haloechinothrix alba]|uniref:Probable cytosol aminopeptidase n=1 Tax=Haloechinothrix alba TaxID=664784 RepID=A0A238WHS4_9PSEU|nr:leucyl aminopeptidase [Haloechinothrix alba]SNR46027.1 leucyl aminopeptidase [Haloechinothrix alba]
MTVPQFALVDSRDDAVTASDSEAIIIATIQGEDGVEIASGSQAVDGAFDGTLAEVLATLGAKGKADEVVKVPTLGRLGPPLVLAAGLGKVDGGITPEQVRRASGAAARALPSGTTHVLSTLSALDPQATVEGTALGAYAFTDYKSESAGEPLATIDLLSPAEGSSRDHQATVTAATSIAEAVILARDLVNTPPNDLYPEVFADRVRELAESVDLSVDVLDEQDLERNGFGGILGVGGGSVRKPRLVRLRYKGSKPVRKVALVGKGITFDTGGISIKPAAGMENMTSDMAGAAAVLATIVLAAKLRYPLEITADIPLAENMPSATAYRPGDVLETYGGTTVEVLNTDAEGRLILADAIARAAEDDPDYLIETSTLTGAQTVALGNRTPGVMGSDEFRDRVADIARRTGEGGWAMPLPEELRGELDSRIADIANVTGNRWGGMLVAGVFLREFVADDLPWVHIDVAGPAFNTTGTWGYTGKGGTGVPVRTMAAVLADLAERD